MTAGSRPTHPPSTAPSHNQTSRTYFEHSSANRINTDAVLVQSLRTEYPNLHLTVVPQQSCNILSFASSGNGALAPIDNEKDRLSWRHYLPPSTRLNGAPGALADSVKFGKYLLDWQGKEYVLFVAEGRDGSEAYPSLTNQYVLSPSVDATNRLLLSVGQWGTELHDQIWVYDGGMWQKSRELWDSVASSSWDSVILPPAMKEGLKSDVLTFFSSRDTYDNLRVPWKRGIIYHGPPGNGKTISVKATMHMLYDLPSPIPTLYVRSLASWAGPEYSINQVFALARRTAPCYLVFEDLDSIITDAVRSYFLNEVDGIRKNDGILMLGSTNHLDRLDPGLAKRPSRFDRKYYFGNPDTDGREAYAKFWQGKLEGNKDVRWPDEVNAKFAGITDGFSFAYMQEAVVASLLALAREGADEGGGNRDGDDGLKSVSVGTDTRFDGWLGEVRRERYDELRDRVRREAYLGGENRLDEISALAQQMQDLKKSVEAGEGKGGLDDLPLWKQLKKQVEILRGEMGDGEEKGASG